MEPLRDDRGLFGRAWAEEEMAAEGLADHTSHINLAFSIKPGTIRGLHWRPLTHPESKFVRCTRGRVFDVCVDIREDSPTYLQWVGVELSADNRLALSVPAGCAHGFQSLDSDSEVIYLASAPFETGIETGARWNDPAFGIDWPITDGVTVSERDGAWPDYAGRVAT